MVILLPYIFENCLCLILLHNLKLAIDPLCPSPFANKLQLIYAAIMYSNESSIHAFGSASNLWCYSRRQTRNIAFLIPAWTSPTRPELRSCTVSATKHTFADRACSASHSLSPANYLLLLRVVKRSWLDLENFQTSTISVQNIGR